MALYLRKLQRPLKLRTLQLSISRTDDNDKLLRIFSSESVEPSDTQAACIGGQRNDGQQVQILTRLVHSGNHSCLHYNCYEVPFVSENTSNTDFYSKRKFLDLKYREFCSGVDSGSESENHDEGESECESGCVESKADPREVDRVCKVIDELFSLDRNMEAILDECGINLTHDLVIDVLERFKHARKPAFRFFCWAAQRPGYVHDSKTYNAMMAILGKTRQFETMVSVLEEMGEKGLLTIETFVIAMKAFAAAKERKKAVGIFELMKKYKFEYGVESINCLLDALGRAKLGKEAQVLFEKLEHRFTPNLQTYTVLINGWCKVKNLMEAGKLWNEMIDKGFKPDLVAHNIMLEGLLRCHKSSDAIKLFEVMKAKGPSPNARSYTILIRHLCKQRKMDEAIEYFEEMLGTGCEPDVAVYTCLITGFGNIKKMDRVYGLLKEMREKGCPPDAQLYNALIKLMSNRRMPDDVVRIYKKMIQNGVQPTIHTYNMMMKSFFTTRNYELGCAVWEEMNSKGCCPDENSYTVFIGASISLRAPQSQFLSGTRLMQAEQCLSSSRVVFIPTSQQRAKPLKFRSLAVKASVDGGRSNGAASFVGGFVLGGIIAGALGCIYAPQISKVLAGAEIPDKKDLMRKLPKFIYDEEKALERTRKILSAKIEQLNTAIDSMSSQLNTKDAPNGIAVNPDELEASI